MFKSEMKCDRHAVPLVLVAAGRYECATCLDEICAEAERGADAEVVALRAEVKRLRAQAIECGTHHPDYIIGIHWLAAAYSRICAGEDEKAVMADYGYAYISLPDRPLTVWEVIRAVELARERITLRVRDAGPTPAALPERIDLKRFQKAPCYICGYNGPNYYQPEVHECAGLYHEQTNEMP